MSSTLNLRELLIGDAIRLRYVTRWGTSRILKPDTTAEHCFYVAFNCMMIGRWLNSRGLDREINMSTLLQRALVHDLEEGRTGDIPRPFKHSDSDLKEAIEYSGTDAFHQIVEKLYQPRLSSENIALMRLWKDGKDDTLEGQILDFADFLTVLSLLYQERQTWNTTLRDHTSSMFHYFDKFNTPKYEFLSPLISQTKLIMAELFDEAFHVRT